jgi:hypothetical protein
MRAGFVRFGSMGSNRTVKSMISLMFLALACCKRAPPPAERTNPRGVERLSRCAVRLVPASPAQRQELKAELGRRLAGGGIVEAELTPRGDSVDVVMMEGLPAPPNFAGTESAAVARAHAVYDSVDDLFAVDAGRLRFSAFGEGRDSRVAWTVTGMAEEPGTQVTIAMEATGRVLVISAKRGEPAPPSPCDAPSLALDDPRIRKAVAGQTVGNGDAVIEAKDVGSVDQGVVPLPERRFGPDAYGRVILVEIRGGLWTALLDPDTAAVIDIQRNFID